MSKFSVGDRVRPRVYGLYADSPGKLAYSHTGLVGTVTDTDRSTLWVTWDNGSIVQIQKRAAVVVAPASSN